MGRLKIFLITEELQGLLSAGRPVLMMKLKKDARTE
jgi:hypothetical protein